MPKIRHTPKASRIGTITGAFGLSTMNLAATTPATAHRGPTDKSMPPVRMTNVMPSARMPLTQT